MLQVLASGKSQFRLETLLRNTEAILLPKKDCFVFRMKKFRWKLKQPWSVNCRSYSNCSSDPERRSAHDDPSPSKGSTIFSPTLAVRFDKLVTLYPVRRSALIPMLLYAQDELGYITDAAIEEIAQRIGITALEVRNVLSYYSLLRTKPVGKYHVQVCTNISCMLRGGQELFEHCKEHLGIGHKETTPDGVFSLEEVECIGACSWAPAVQVNYDFHDNLTADSMDAVLDQYRKQAGK